MRELEKFFYEIKQLSETFKVKGSISITIENENGVITRNLDRLPIYEYNIQLPHDCCIKPQQ